MDVETVKGIFTTLPIDMVAAVVFATLITVVTLRLGASISIAFSLSLITASVLFSSLPGTFGIGALVSGTTSPYVAGGIYIALTLLLTFILYRATSTLSDESSGPLFAIATGFATTVVLLVMWNYASPLQAFWTFNPAIQAAFGAAYRLYWLLLAFIAFAFVKS